MDRHEIVDRIQRLNPTATAAFLDDFGDEDLLAYLRQLQELDRERRTRGELEPVLSA